MTDGVTPLPLPMILAVLSRGDVLQTFAMIRALGAGATVIASGIVAVLLGEVGQRRAAWLGAATFFGAMPVFAWASAGLETGLLPLGTALALLAFARGRDVAASLCLGVLAALRHELLPFCLVLAVLYERGATFVLSRAQFVRVALVIAPVIAVVVARQIAFGRPMPLSIVAKAPVVSLGATYAVACFLLAGGVALCAPMSFVRVSLATRAMVVAVLAHVAAIAFAGGDWMPFARLFVPVVPAVALAAAGLAVPSAPWALAVRFALSLGGELFMWKHAERARGVEADRRALAVSARPELAGACVVATIDIGWVSVATGARIVDLAGVTDPSIAHLPGGHTTKRIPDELWDTREVDALVLQLANDAQVAEPWWQTRFARGAERYVAQSPALGERFVAGAAFGDRARYVVVRRAGARVCPDAPP